MKIVNVCLGFLFALLLFGQVYQHIPYQLCHMEHTHLFLEDSDWFLACLGRMGGMVQWLATYGIQFLDRPIVGVIVFILPVWLLFVVTALLMHGNVKSSAVWVPAAVWVSVCQLITLYDHNFYWSGVWALLFSLASLLLVSCLKASFIRNLFFVLGIPVVAWLCGSSVLVYVVGGGLLFFVRKDGIWMFLLSLSVYIGVMAVACYRLWCPSWAMAFSPLMYYESLLDFPLRHWWVWGSVVIVLAVTRCLPLLEGKKVVAWTCNLLGWMVPCVFLFQYGPKFCNSSNHDLWRLNHYAYTEDWDAILQFLSERPMNNYLFMNYANMALAEKGELGDKAFLFRPRGINALQVSVNSTGSVRLLVSDVNYTVGCIAEAQQHAFEAQVTFSNSLGIQTLKRLVKTNLIFGHHEVAEKYLSLIAKTTFHKEWAEKYRAFLYDDGAIEKDAELGAKRRNLSEHNRFTMFYGWRPELEDILEVNPQNEAALTYLGLSYLLSKDMKGFHAFMDKYYAGKTLKEWPLAFQQGQVIWLHQNKEAWENVGLADEVVNEYKQYLALYVKNRQHPSLKNMMNRSFGHTFWYYLMFV